MEEKKQQVDDVEQQNESAKSTPDNLRFYKQGCEVPNDALKKIQAGRLKGMSDVNPMWRMKRMTEIFGPCGIGWKYTIDRQWVEAYGDDVKCFCNVSLFVRDPETQEWSDAIPGNGGSAIVSKEKSGLYVNDEGYKMALTDALSIAMKPLGIGANVWYGSKANGHNESKYEYYTQEQSTQPSATFTGAQLQQAINEINAVTDRKQYEAVWGKWAAQCPALCQNGTDFYKAVCAKANQLKAAE